MSNFPNCRNFCHYEIFMKIVKVYQNSNFVKIMKFCPNYKILWNCISFLSKWGNLSKLQNFVKNCKSLWRSWNFLKIVKFRENYEIINIQKFCQNWKLFQSKLWILWGFYNIVINVKFSQNCWIFWKLEFCQKVTIFQNGTTFSQMLLLVKIRRIFEIFPFLEI
jgi:hypothetical protein